MNVSELIAFEEEVAAAFSKGLIHGPVHLSGGNEEQLIRIFKEVKPEDWVLSTWRSHYHALLKSIPRERVMADILASRSMMLHYPEHKFLTSAIVGGILPIACGLAAEGETVWCFVGDMTATTGLFFETLKYATEHAFRLEFVVEDNGLSTNTPTREAWGGGKGPQHFHIYHYERKWPHYQPLPSNQGF